MYRETATLPWKRKFKEKEYPNLELAESFLVDGRPLVRGTPEWDAREDARKASGCHLISKDQ